MVLRAALLFHRLAIFLWLMFAPSQIASFAPTTLQTRVIIPSTSKVCLFGTINLAGDSSSKIQFEVDPSQPSFEEWMQSSASDRGLLGAKAAKQRPDGLWDCSQPEIAFFGLDLVPIFVNKIDRTPTAVIVSILQARTDVLDGRANLAVAAIMEKSTFVGKSVIKTRRIGKTNSVSVDLTLTLQAPLPPFVLLPPGFNSIGSAIIENTCRTRTSSFLEDLKKSYREWAREASKQ
jgi:hypothetical protein